MEVRGRGVGRDRVGASGEDGCHEPRPEVHGRARQGERRRVKSHETPGSEPRAKGVAPEPTFGELRESDDAMLAASDRAQLLFALHRQYWNKMIRRLP
jgi:hypothetical protein